MFYVIIENGCKNVERIHPQKQQICTDISNNVGKYCNDIIVFGSATTLDHHYWSDLDIFIDLKEINDYDFVYRKISELSNFNCDILCKQKNVLVGQILENIEKGVSII